MKKLSILSMVFAVTAIVLLMVSLDGNAQSAKKVRKIIEESNLNYVRWFNAGEVDSLMTIFRDDACLVGDGCGKAYVRQHMTSLMGAYKIKELRVLSVSVADSIAVEKGRWSIELNDGPSLSGEYLTEWRRTKKLWQIVNDISSD